MISDITRDTLSCIRNPKLAAYASMYVDIYDDFMRQVEATGVEIDTEDHRREAGAMAERLRRRGAIFRNDDKSIYINRISPACIACQKGINSQTFFLSLRCNRNCFFCFNPNQEGYEFFQQRLRDCRKELEQIRAAGQTLEYVGLTGGEPLVHRKQVMEFFTHARELFPGVHTRLYTNGDLADKETLQELRAAGLHEIRFSIRMHEHEAQQRFTLNRIALAREYIPAVMVEMPILPDTLDAMKGVLVELDRLGIYGMNLLEFCYPLVNAKTFRAKSYKIKNPPYRVLYNYWYAGGLPVSGSELACLSLMEFALDRGLRMGLHYCSLENKHTGQVYQQNVGRKVPPVFYFSPKDFFLKSAKVFGKDVAPVRRRLDRIGYRDYHIDGERGCLEFHVQLIRELAPLDVEVGVTYNVVEDRSDGRYIRELKISLTTPTLFDLQADA